MRKGLENYQGLQSFFLLCIPVTFCLGNTIPLPIATSVSKLFTLHGVLCLSDVGYAVFYEISAYAVPFKRNCLRTAIIFCKLNSYSVHL